MVFTTGEGNQVGCDNFHAFINHDGKLLSSTDKQRVTILGNLELLFESRTKIVLHLPRSSLYVVKTVRNYQGNAKVIRADFTLGLIRLSLVGTSIDTSSAES